MAHGNGLKASDIPWHRQSQGFVRAPDVVGLARPNQNDIPFFVPNQNGQRTLLGTKGIATNGARTLLAPGLTTSNKKLLGTRSKNVTRSFFAPARDPEALPRGPYANAAVCC